MSLSLPATQNTASAAASATIGTHDGTFHCDEAMACWLLKQTVEFESATIIRTRDLNLLNQLNIVVDVGGVYEPAKYRFDHHQRGFLETLDSHHTMKLSSAGLIYKHFGREVIQTLIHRRNPSEEVKQSDLEIIYDRVYKIFIEALDGIDNGITQFPCDVQPVYQICTDLSSRIAQLNPSWNENLTVQETNQRFLDAVELTGKEFAAAVYSVAYSWLPARQVVETALKQRFEVHASGQIVFLQMYTVWKSHLSKLEAEIKGDLPILYVLYKDTSSGKYRIQAVAVDGNAFESRKALPEPWRGLKDAELAKLTGVEDAIFVHASGFIGGAHTKEGVCKLAELALQFDAPVKRQKL